MKLAQLKCASLLKPLQTVSGIVEKRHTLPILSNVLIERTGERLLFLATDLEIQVTTSFVSPQIGAEPGLFTVSARKLQEILRALPEEAEVTIEAQNNRLQVRSGKSCFNLQTLPAENFPRLTSSSAGEKEIHLQQKELRNLLLLVQYAMAQQDIRYYLNGMLLLVEEGTIKVVATDGHRLAMAMAVLSGEVEHQEVILPRKAVLELAKLLHDSDEEVIMQLSSNQVCFTFDDVTVVSKVVDGKFPDYTRVVPSKYEKKFEIGRFALQQALQRVAILANEKFRGVRWMLTTDSLRIACTNTEQEEAYEELETNYGGDPLDIGFNVTYLLDVLNNISTDKVTCAFGDANSSVLITFAENAGFRYVVMPMRI